MSIIPTPLLLPLMMSLIVAAASGQKVEELPASPTVPVTSSQTVSGSPPDKRSDQDTVSLERRVVSDLPTYWRPDLKWEFHWHFRSSLRWLDK